MKPNTFKRPAGYNQKLITFIVFWTLMFLIAAVLVLLLLQDMNQLAYGIDDEIKHLNDVG